MVIIIFVCVSALDINVYGASLLSNEPDHIDPKLKERLKSLNPDDVLLAWIDVQARTDRFNDLYLPGDPALLGIGWILITFDPNIEQNHLFWILAEVKSGKVPEFAEIPWVKNITLIKTGEYVRLSENPKLAMEGMGSI